MPCWTSCWPSTPSASCPTDFDVSHPVGTGPFTYQRFVPGQLSQFDRYDNYWDGPPFVDELIIYDFADDAAKVNALLAGQVQSIDNLPNYLADTIEQQGASPLISETGAWVPFTMRVDVAPFSDVRVRQALRLIVDRQQMIDQALERVRRSSATTCTPRSTRRTPTTCRSGCRTSTRPSRC